MLRVQVPSGSGCALPHLSLLELGEGHMQFLFVANHLASARALQRAL